MCKHKWLLFLQIISNFFSRNSDCVCAYTCACTHAHACMKASTCALRHARLKSKSGVFYYRSYILRQSLSASLELAALTRLTGQEASHIPSLSVYPSDGLEKLSVLPGCSPRSQDLPKPIMESALVCKERAFTQALAWTLVCPAQRLRAESAQPNWIGFF